MLLPVLTVRQEISLNLDRIGQFMVGFIESKKGS